MHHTAKTYEIWICGRWKGADWDLAEHRNNYDFARRCAEKWRERGFKTAIYGPDGLRIQN